VTFGLENLFIFGKVSDFCYTSRLSAQNGEICLQKYPPTSGKVSITNYLKQNAFDYQAHLPIENKLRNFENKHNYPPRKKRMGTSIDAGKGAKGTISPKFVAFLVILCFERWCRKQNTVARLKQKICPPKICALATPLGTRRDKSPKKQGCQVVISKKGQISR